MNVYNIVGLIITCLLMIVLDKGRILRDLVVLIALLLYGVWAAIIASILCPIGMTIMTMIGPVLRWWGVIKLDTEAFQSIVYTLLFRKKEKTNAG